MKAEFHHQFNLEHAQKKRDIRTKSQDRQFYLLWRFYLLCLPAWAGSHLAPFCQSSPSQLCQLWNQEENLKWEENTPLYMHCCTASRGELAALRFIRSPVFQRAQTQHWPGIFSWVFMENVGFKIIVHAVKTVSLLPSLLHLPCRATHLSVHLYSRAGVISLSPFEWSYWAQD